MASFMGNSNRPRYSKLPNGNTTEEETVDRQNLERAGILSEKVSRLKSLALDIEGETKGHNHLLDGLEDDFEGTTGLLSGSLNRVHALLGTGRNNRRLMCYVSSFIIVFLLFIYFLMSKATSPNG
ncbi:unnamed protein product [Darwinula stevensoni]|uniref:t-SNARE coiled-coil homology domain-containing protein n=1 Tax=Darwinula stevensoni TaxID=69355 RepID=A0A7R9FRZ7_9CRUS|nr:unnamed protein product [Darwinula stevensoni]CAG0902430.1 unnamed protein product [Darwinula stevensoni]